MRSSAVQKKIIKFDTDTLTAADWQAAVETLQRELEKTTARLEMTQLIALALLFALAGVLAFR